MRRLISYEFVIVLSVLLILSFLVVTLAEARRHVEQRVDYKRLYVTLEIGRNLAVVDGDVRFVPVVTVTWGDKQVVASINQFGSASGTLDTGKRPKVLDDKAAMRLLRAVEALKQILDDLEE